MLIRLFNLSFGHLGSTIASASEQCPTWLATLSSVNLDDAALSASVPCTEPASGGVTHSSSAHTQHPATSQLLSITAWLHVVSSAAILAVAAGDAVE